MKYGDRKVAGALLLIAGVQCVLGMIIAEAFYPGYSTSENYISDLGVGPSSLIFNSSVFLLGVLAFGSAYFLQRASNFRLLAILAALAGIGAMGVGLFTEDAGEIHGIFSLITFLFGGLSAILSYRLQKPPLSYLSVILGVFSLLSLVLFGSGVYLGLGKGGMERMIAYPALLWAVGFGGYLISCSSDTFAAKNHSP
ncbi:MAG: DUF998 domain-containing protein [Candidatus Bathyarchaeota archaeon]|nr:DUF998 domain-containing protein [Candidatus Bathyarchaeota archaeon]